MSNQVNKTPASPPPPPQNDLGDGGDDWGDGNIGEGQGIDDGSGFGDEQGNSFHMKDITRDQIMELFHKVEGSKGSDTQHLLDILRDALRSLPNDKEHAIEDYEQVAAQVPENTSPTGDEGGDGLQPTRVEDGINYYEATDGNKDFSLTAKGDKGQNVITTTGNVEISLKDPANDKVTLAPSTDSNYLLVKINHGGTEEVYKVSKSVASLRIKSDNITGDAQGLGDKLTTGVDGGSKYVSSSDKQGVANKLSAAVNKVGSTTGQWDYPQSTDPNAPNYQPPSYGGYGTGYGGVGGPTPSYNGHVDDPNHVYAVGYTDSRVLGTSDGSKAEADAVKGILTRISQAINEPDPKKRDDLWNSINDELDRWKSQDTTGGGSCNNKAQLLFNVLYGELGEQGMKDAFSKGILDVNFARSLAGDLTAMQSENTEMQNEITDYQHGGPGWTHQSSADFLTKYATGPSKSDSGDGGE
ncbi:MAG: hypothetical protein U1F57_02365 [bacterium]